MKKFWFAGECSADYGLMISGSGTFNSAERDLEKISVMGRNGDLIKDNGRFKNVPASYPISICRNFSQRASAVRSWLSSQRSYQRLEDEYHPDEYRMAMFVGPIEFDVGFLNQTGETTIFFDCKPQRFLKSGEAPVTFTSGAGTIENPTRFEALPKITVYGSDAGTVTIGGTVVEVKSITDQITIDCETMQAYRQVGDGVPENYNGNIYAPEFPVLRPGENAVGFAGGITRVELIPRWWTI